MIIFGVIFAWFFTVSYGVVIDGSAGRIADFTTRPVPIKPFIR